MGILDKLLYLVTLPEEESRQTENETEPTGARPAPAGSFPDSVSLLLDRSGSMNDQDFHPSRIEAAVNAATSMVKSLARNAPGCLIGIGTFSSKFHLCINPTPAGAGYQDIVDSLNKLGKSGSTEMAKGLKGMQKMTRECPEGGHNILMMLTDGHNTGRSPRRIAEDLKNSGIEFWAIGIGGSPSDVDEALLRKIVSSEDHYIFIGNWEGPEAISETFQNIIYPTSIE